MFIYDIIEKKRHSNELTREEIDFAVNGYVKGDVSNEQMSALLMAITINGMTDTETYNLTKAMQLSGKTYKFDFVTVDKHSTGGVGDSTTFIIAPTLACLGLNVAKMSGSSLGHTGGTIDKLKVFNGYNPQMTEKAFVDMLKKCGCAIISQSEDVAKADKLMYALRDRTATVDSIPLVASSIMSKKLASGTDVIVLDVKYGAGAFMKTEEQACELARLMVKIGRKDGKKVSAVVTNMNMPLSVGVGCNEEIYSVIKALDGDNSPLLELSKYLSAKIYSIATNSSFANAKKLVNEVIASGAVKQKLYEMITLGGGNADILNNPESLLISDYVIQVSSTKRGYITNIDALKIAKFVKHLKDGVENDKQKQRTGVLLTKNLGDAVAEGEELVKVFASRKISDADLNMLLDAFTITATDKFEYKLIAEVIK